jgi:hypothetical protein
MPLHLTLQALADLARQADNEDRLDKERKQARAAWARRIIAEHKAAQARADEAWARLIDEDAEALDDDDDDDGGNDDEDELDDVHPPEQDEADAIMAQIIAARDHDRWPRELYWSL